MFYLDHKSPDESIVEIFERDLHPAGRFAQLGHLDLLQVVEVRAAANAENDTRIGKIKI